YQAEYIRHELEGELISEEAEFVTNYNGDGLVISNPYASWLWPHLPRPEDSNILPFKHGKHPTIRGLKLEQRELPPPPPPPQPPLYLTKQLSGDLSGSLHRSMSEDTGMTSFSMLEAANADKLNIGPIIRSARSNSIMGQFLQAGGIPRRFSVQTYHSLSTVNKEASPSAMTALSDQRVLEDPRLGPPSHFAETWKRIHEQLISHYQKNRQATKAQSPLSNPSFLEEPSAVKPGQTKGEPSPASTKPPDRSASCVQAFEAGVQQLELPPSIDKVLSGISNGGSGTEANGSADSGSTLLVSGAAEPSASDTEYLSGRIVASAQLDNTALSSFVSKHAPMALEKRSASVPIDTSDLHLYDTGSWAGLDASRGDSIEPRQPSIAMGIQEGGAMTQAPHHHQQQQQQRASNEQATVESNIISKGDEERYEEVEVIEEELLSDLVRSLAIEGLGM
ncbi:hypothetical protein EV182_003869, partial [Spiromyces aspiralis]